MKLSDVIHRLTRSKENEAYPDINLFASELNVSGVPGWSEKFNERMTGWYVHSWCDTDSQVGNAVYFFDDTPVAVGIQNGRKSTESLRFINNNAADSVRDFLFEIIKEDCEHLATQYIDLNQDIKEYVSCRFSDELRYNYKNRMGVWAGNPVMVSRIFSGYNFKKSPNNPRCDEIEIVLPDGAKIIVPCSQVYFKINVV